MNNFYVALISMSVFIMLVLIIMILDNDILIKRTKKKFIIVAILVSIASILEFLGELLNGSDNNYRTLHIIVKFLELSITPFIPFVYGSSVYKLKNKTIPIIILALHTILQALSLKFGFIFTVDQNNLYHRSNLYYIYYITYLSGFILFLYQIHKYTSKYQKQKKIELAFIILFTFGGIICQIFYDSLKVVWLTISVGILMFYIHYNSILLQVDSLTGLLNRGFFDKKLLNLKKKAVIIFFDINDFKEINDTKGHVFGDQCLTSVADFIKEIFGKVGLCYRYGGDEFCVIMTKKTDEIDRYISTFTKSNKQMNLKSNGSFPIISCGYAVYNIGDNIQDIVKLSDERMYENKLKTKTIKK